jgi:hypothetical protein
MATVTILLDENNFTCVVSYFLIQLLSNNAGECLRFALCCLFMNWSVTCMAFTELTASDPSRMPYVMCMLDAPVLSRSQLPYSVSSHSPQSCQAPPPFIRVQINPGHGSVAA